MAKQWRKLKTLLSEFADIPADILWDLPRMTLIGQLHVYIENHKGIFSFTDHELQLNLTKGRLKISGENLVLKILYSDEILLEGWIRELAFIDLNES